jgi:hypothetical protein
LRHNKFLARKYTLAWQVDYSLIIAVVTSILFKSSLIISVLPSPNYYFQFILRFQANTFRKVTNINSKILQNCKNLHISISFYSKNFFTAIIFIAFLISIFRFTIRRHLYTINYKLAMQICYSTKPSTILHKENKKFKYMKLRHKIFSKYNYIPQANT